MADKSQYFVVKQKAVPEVLLKVVEEGPPYAAFLLLTDNAAALLAATGCHQLHGSFKTSRTDISATHNPAVSFSGGVCPPEEQVPVTFHENARGKTITFVIQMNDQPGLLSDVLKVVAEHRANILTIHQSIPINGMASTTISVDVLPDTGNMSEMMEMIEGKEGVQHLKILGGE